MHTHYYTTERGDLAGAPPIFRDVSQLQQQELTPIQIPRACSTLGSPREPTTAGLLDGHFHRTYPAAQRSVSRLPRLGTRIPQARCVLVLNAVLVYCNAMEALLERITFNPKQCGGRPCIRGMRIRVGDVLDLLAAGLSMDQIVEEMPDLEVDDIKACLAFAQRRIDHPFIAA